MRQDLIAAKLDRQSAVIADADRLKAMDQADRPGDASMNDVRTAYADAMDEVAEGHASVSSIEGIDLPSDRLGGGS